jgi:AmiR/NasT family two-component response regulator
MTKGFPMTRILLGDFGAVTRLGFEDALREEGVQLVESAADDLRERVIAVLPDVVVIDLDRRDAAELAARVVTQFPAVKVIACSSVEPKMRIYPPFHGGESYVTELSLERLMAAIRV